MHTSHKLGWGLTCLLGVMLSRAGPGFAQVSPAEIANPRLKAAEQAHFSQLQAMNREIAKIKFPFPFVLSRYAGLDPKEQRGTDARGLEFVLFRDRVVLKISANYNAAFNSSLLTENQRANRLFDDVIVPILQLVPKYFSSQSNFNGFGFEIAYHARTQGHSYDYEGKEILTLVFDKADAFGYLNAQRPSERQEILDGSVIYLNGKEFGLALGAKDPSDVEGLEKPRWTQAAAASEKESAPVAPTANAPGSGDSRIRLPNLGKDPPQGFHKTAQGQALMSSTQNEPAARLTRTAASHADVDALQAKYQSQVDALAKEGVVRYHFVDYAPPSFAIFQNQIYLQITLRNPAAFDRNATSIYKRAAQSFDLFLAPVLRPVLDKIPKSEEVAGLDITVINEFASRSVPPSEAVEFVCLLRPLQQFADAEITNQDLINQSIVLVNGVRIALSLQQVE